MELWVQYGVGIASWVIVILFLIQVGIFVGLYLLFKRTLNMVEEMRKKYEPQVDKMMVTVNDLQKTVANVTETVNTVSTEVRAVSAAVTTSAERISVVATESA